MSKLADFENASLKNAFDEMIEGLGIFTEGLMSLNSKAKDEKRKEKRES